MSITNNQHPQIIPYPLVGAYGKSSCVATTTSACLNRPTEIGVDTSETLYIADTGNHLIRKYYGNSTLIKNKSKIRQVVAILGLGSNKTSSGYSSTSSTTMPINNPESFCDFIIILSNILLFYIYI